LLYTLYSSRAVLMFPAHYAHGHGIVHIIYRAELCSTDTT
jgi:hypothetical protein